MFETTPTAFPDKIFESIYDSSPMFLLTPSDSPVRDDSSTIRLFDSIKIKSAGTFIPSSKSTMSPIVSSSESIVLISPSLFTMACFVINVLSISTAFWERYSCIKPMMTFNKMAKMITPASITSPIA